MRTPLLIFLLLTLSAQAFGQSDEPFTKGPLIEDFGPAATVPEVPTVPSDMHLRVRFDVSAGAERGELNRSLVTAARFLNMHARTGVDADRMHLAIVIHGRAVFDVLQAGPKQGRANAALVAALRQHDVRLYVCGQSAAYYEVTAQQLLPGVEMSLSAMTAHALLAAEGYELNPF